MFDEARDADHGSMRTMRGAERIADEKAVAKRRQSLRKNFVVFFFLGMKADIFEEKNVAVSE